MWMCDRCQEINDDKADNCAKCGWPKGGVAPTPPSPPPPPTNQPSIPNPPFGVPPPIGGMPGALPSDLDPNQAPGGQAPRLLDTSVDHGGGPVPYRIEGQIVPVLHLSLSNMPVYFEHYVLLWKSPSVNIGIKALQGAGRRLLAGLPIFITQAVGPGEIAFSRDGAGHVFAIHLQPGEELDVREHQFLAATDNVDYSYQWVKGISNILFSGTGLFIDHFRPMAGEGVVWLHGYGNVFEKVLGPMEILDVEPGGWVYKDPTVQMDTVVQPLSTGLFASSQQLVFNRFTGPGRIGIQSMYVHLQTSN